MPDLEPQPAAHADRPDPAPDPLAGLYRMSTTAGVSTQEYVAINPTAIAALILGCGSVLVLLTDMFLVVPAAGVVCGLVAINQIRKSNRTQTGIVLAALGLLLSLVIGGGKAGYDAVTALRTTADERQIATLMHQLGDDLAARNYEKAYARFDDRFRERVSLATFVQSWDGFNDPKVMGPLRSVDWNEQRMAMDDRVDTGGKVANGMAFFKYANNDQPRRVVFGFEKLGGVWRVDDIEGLFPQKKQPQQ